MTELQAGNVAWCNQLLPLWRLDGTDGQEDELDDVHKGILDAPTDNEGPGSVDELNRDPNASHKDERRDTLEDLERRAGFRPIRN